MLKPSSPQQHELEMVTLESLEPSNHLLRQIDQFIEFDFIREKTKHLYSSDNGRPPVDPIVLFKMLFIGYLFGIRSERQLVREIEVNVAYRWFLGYRLTDKIPDASTISQNRRRRFVGTTIQQDIFDEIVLQAIGHGLVGGNTLYTDSTHLKASANKNKFDIQPVEVSPAAYLAELEKAVEEDRAAEGKKPLKAKAQEKEIKEKKISTTDKDSGYMVREGKPKGFFYLDHRTVDGRCSIITDSYSTPASIHDSKPYLDRLDRQIKRFNFDVDAVGLDAGYSTPAICKGLVDRDIYGVIGYRRPNGKKGLMKTGQFKYDDVQDAYQCPEGKHLIYSTTNRNGYREYKSDPNICKQCPRLNKCTHSKNHTKVITRHLWAGYKEEVDSHRLTEEGKQIYQRRKETVERSFADAKQLHGHRYARLRGLEKVAEQCLMAAACQNMKKIAQILAKKGLFLINSLYFVWVRPISAPVNKYI